MTLAEQIRDTFKREDIRAQAWGASSDDGEEYGVEWNFADGARLWLDFSDRDISIWWKAPGEQGKRIKFIPATVSA